MIFISLLCQGLPYVELKGGDKWPLFSVSLSTKVILFIQVTDFKIYRSCILQPADASSFLNAVNAFDD